ncbi:MAG: GNAT family N-acetyltransferase [Candidatus Kariarchaeaceae archaeon]
MKTLDPIKEFCPQEITRFIPLRDMAEVVLIEISRFDDPMSKMLINFLAKRYGLEYFFVIDISGNGKLDGYILSGVEKTKTLHIYTIAVKKEFEGMGWGKKLLWYLINQAKSDELQQIVLEVKENNTRAQMLYKRLGFAVTGEELNYYNDGRTAIKMRLDLNIN